MILPRHLALTYFVAATALPLTAAVQAAPSALATQAAAALPNDSVDSLVQAARVAAQTDRNRESAHLFAQAIALAPERRRELLQEYADQLTYSDRSSQAVPLYEHVLVAPRSQDEKLRALKGLGIAYLWSDRPSQARSVFQTFLRENPADQDVRRNLGRALSWSGRQREAIAYLQQLLSDHPDDQEARLQLAQSQAWMGRHDLATQTLEGVTANREDASKLREELARATAPRTVVDAQQSKQSDQLNIRSVRLGHALSFQDGRGAAGFRLERTEYEREDQSDSAEVSRPVVHGRYRLSDAFEINAEVGRERINPRGGPARDATVYSSWLTWWPSDLFRFDLSTSRSSFDNLQSLRLGITAQQNALSMDFTPSERQRYSGRIERASYSDGNARRGSQLQAEYRLFPHPEAWVGVRHTRFTFDRQTNNGYFNPLTFYATQLTLRSTWRPDGPEGRWELGANAAFGGEHAQPDGNKPASDFSLRAGYKIDAETRLEIRLQRFSSLTSASGFSRNTFGLTLARTW